MRNPFNVLAEGLVSENCRGERTAIELFLAGVQGREAGLWRRLCHRKTAAVMCIEMFDDVSPRQVSCARMCLKWPLFPGGSPQANNWHLPDVFRCHCSISNRFIFFPLSKFLGATPGLQDRVCTCLSTSAILRPQFKRTFRIRRIGHPCPIACPGCSG